jgi:hypothetical protein
MRDPIRTALRRDFPNWAVRLGDDHTIDLSVLGTLSDTASPARCRSPCWPTAFPTPSSPAAIFFS